MDNLWLLAYYVNENRGYHEVKNSSHYLLKPYFIACYYTLTSGLHSSINDLFG